MQETIAQAGVVFVAQALDAVGCRMAERTFNWSLDNPGPHARPVFEATSGSFYQDHANPAAFPHYQPLLAETALSKLVAKVLGTEALWLLYEQIWLKEGNAKSPTPWHQDLAYMPMSGEHIATAWINLDPVPKQFSLEFARGSHLGPLYNPTAFDAADPTAALFDDDAWPPLPDVANNRGDFDIVSWRVEPGDVIIFHPAILHGGAASPEGGRRRSISLRFFGDSAWCAERPDLGLDDAERLRRLSSADPIEQLSVAVPGSPFRHPSFHRLI